jgi:hypothetical protein
MQPQGRVSDPPAVELAKGQTVPHVRTADHLLVRGAVKLR